jgi:hypothetical protein
LLVLIEATNEPKDVCDIHDHVERDLIDEVKQNLMKLSKNFEEYQNILVSQFFHDDSG